eukprot:TRINITY_DN1827_c0_g1_i11.p1 TRINITY_DN1827_c0_g1~~TRINITY_DN1827_c0_g1_i11.p1  ORF type:complete len:536 (+),score=112.05 TRINITY_DN1827_c0_g1_i11:175-1782(+)
MALFCQALNSSSINSPKLSIFCTLLPSVLCKRYETYSIFSSHVQQKKYLQKCPTTHIVCFSSFEDSASAKHDPELARLLALVPSEMRRVVTAHPEFEQLIEIVMDLGRIPLARFPSGDFIISNDPVTHHHLKQAISKVGDFADDNRAGIDRSLHRISAIRNRRGHIIGLTCRVGRAISGSADMLQDLIEGGGSLLIIGPPGVGKTTVIRDIARMLADDFKKRVVVVDTSNEIAGDGDIPHRGIGSARRMQVPNVDLQHKVMIEAVENHMPQTIVIDEIGTELEALAAGTIAQRGIQLVGTAHGMTIENLIKNPSLDVLIGGIQIVEDEVEQILEAMGLETEVQLTDDIGEADAILGLHSKIKKNLWIREIAKFRQLPIFVTKTNMKSQLIRAMDTILGMEHFGMASPGSYRLKKRENQTDKKAANGKHSLDEAEALEEARLAIEQIVLPKGQPVELFPRPSRLLHLQMKLAEGYNLSTQKVGAQSNERLRILPLETSAKEEATSDLDAIQNWSEEINIGETVRGTTVERLPFLPQ